ncbi:potassium/proton antiporter [Stomatohabitans albus]|uniref:potassium/proton antiporter n=1 Tax=Stomatohabitans albus TaxID=3110766 RepID=UPI00300C4B9D
MRTGPGLVLSGGIAAVFAWASLDLQSNFAALPFQQALIAAVAVGGIAAAVSHHLSKRFGEMRFREISGGIAVGGVITIGLAIVLQLLQIAPTGQSHLEIMLPFDTGIGIAGALLVLGILVAVWGDRQATPTSLFLMAVGMVLSNEMFGLTPYLNTENAAAIASLALVIILFDGGLGTTRRHLDQGLGPGLSLATVGVVITALIVGLVAHYGLGLPLILSLLLGAALSPTDAAAVLTLLDEIPLPSRAASILRIESGTNDPVAILITAGLVASADFYPSVHSWVVFGVIQAVGGLSVGLMLGFLGAIAVNRVARVSPSTAAVLGLAVALSVYGAAVAVGVSGFLAVYVAGFIVRSRPGTGQVATTRLTGALGIGAETALFLLIGMMTTPATLVGAIGQGIMLAAVLLFVARPFAALISLAPFRIPAGEGIAISWLGLRGAVPIVLATIMILQGTTQSDQLFNIVLIVVVVSLLVQSLSAKPVLDHLDLPADTHEPIEIDALPLEGVDPNQFSMYQVVVPSDSPLVGHELWESPPPNCLRLVSISRDEETLNPRGSTVIQAHDVLVVSADISGTTHKEVCAWITPQDEREADLSPP